MRVFLLGLAAVAVAACGTVGSVAADPVGPIATMANNGPASVTYSPPPEQQLLDLERQISASAQTNGLGGALGAVIDPADGFVMRPGAMLQGSEAISAGLPNSRTGPIFWTPDRVFVSQGGDMGMTSGRYVQVVAGAEAVQGRYIAVWRKDGSGQWRLLSESRAADPVRAPAAARRAAAH